MVRFEEFISKLQNLEGQIFPQLEATDEKSTALINSDIELLKKVYYDLQEEILLLDQIFPKITLQFEQQIQELHLLLQGEKSEREEGEEKLVITLQTISEKIQTEVLQNKEMRKKNEEGLLNLMESIIGKMKNELNDYYEM